MATTYRINITDSKPSVHDTVNVTCVVQASEDDGKTWTDVREVTVQLDAQAVLSYVNDPSLDKAQKAGMLMKYIRAEVRKQRIEPAQRAHKRMLDVLGQLPVAIDMVT